MTIKKITTLLSVVLATTFVVVCSGDPYQANLKKLKKVGDDVSKIIELNRQSAVCVTVIRTIPHDYDGTNEPEFMQEWMHYHHLLAQPDLLFHYHLDLSDKEITHSINSFICNDDKMPPQLAKSAAKSPMCKKTKHANRDALNALERVLYYRGDYVDFKDAEREADKISSMNKSEKDYDNNKSERKYIAKNCKI